jgi:hypothetical protein
MCDACMYDIPVLEVCLQRHTACTCPTIFMYLSYICMYERVCICIYTCRCVCIYVTVNVCVHVCVCERECVCIRPGRPAVEAYCEYMSWGAWTPIPAMPHCCCCCCITSCCCWMIAACEIFSKVITLVSFLNTITIQRTFENFYLLCHELLLLHHPVTPCQRERACARERGRGKENLSAITPFLYMDGWIEREGSGI